jgi:hypothetical protein
MIYYFEKMAKTGLAHCQVCHQVIEKDTPRMGIEGTYVPKVWPCHQRWVKWFHLACSYQPIQHVMRDALNEMKIAICVFFTLLFWKGKENIEL